MENANEGGEDPERKMEKLRDCIEDMLKFTLVSHVNDAFDIGLGLSREFCSHLLRQDPHDPYPDAATESFEGVPLYPLYKRLAMALLRSIYSGSVGKTYQKNISFMNAETWLKQKEVWSRLILARGSELANACESATSYVHHLSEPAAQPCIIMATLLSELSYEGVQSLLGFSHTVGTICSALSPPRSALLSSFMLPYRPQIIKLFSVLYCLIQDPFKDNPDDSTVPYIEWVKGCLLTHGTRALAKHVDRSSEKFWGRLKGSDSDKNKHALDVINHLINSCCWLNVHVVQPYGSLFEIRIADGYGARWSEDGSKFIGFLEPYMDDGHSRGWKH